MGIGHCCVVHYGDVHLVKTRKRAGAECKRSARRKDTKQIKQGNQPPCPNPLHLS